MLAFVFGLPLLSFTKPPTYWKIQIAVFVFFSRKLWVRMYRLVGTWGHPKIQNCIPTMVCIEGRQVKATNQYPSMLSVFFLRLHFVVCNR